MPVFIHDAMAREKRLFEPADPRRVTLYACGPTVYNHAHIGNFRACVVFDLLFRLLRFEFGAEAVVYARNFTDIDDKIIRAARERGDPIDAVTSKFAEIYRREAAALVALPPTLEPTATGHIGEMIDMVARLVEAGAAYVADGHVLFDVDAFPGYGALSGADREEMLAGARVEVAPYKRGPADFVLWKPADPADPGWESPWGRGRPGWHLECSAMIEKALGETIDIHGGGADLRFPHHENEIAQSVCAHDGAPLARYWMHNGFLRMGADKMSKSVGNVVLVRDLLEAWPGEAIRFALLSAHYRQPLEWTDELLAQSRRQLDRFYRLIGEFDDAALDGVSAAPARSVILALSDDLNTPEAIAGLHELRDIAAQMPPEARLRAAAGLRASGRLMGLLQQSPKAWFQTAAAGPSPEEIEALLAERASARARRDFAAADRIRGELAAVGVVIEDGPDGATWRRG